MKAISDALTGFLQLLYPKRATCVGCGSLSGSFQDWFCDECRQALAQNWIGAAALEDAPEIFGAAFCYRYRSPARGMVLKLKYQGIYRIADYMADEMTKAVQAIQPTGADVVVPVPMHPKRQRQRGYNHAELLARGVAEGLNLPCVCALERTKNTRQQARLDKQKRLGNLKGVVACTGDVWGKRVLLVDDVCTTGATARTCASVLKQSGANAVYLLCYARAELDK